MTPEVTHTPALSPLRRKGALAALVATALFGLGCAIGGDVVTYDVPPESARYKFEAETNGVTTQWEYTSSRPAAGDAPEQQPCMATALGVTEGECRPEPLIFLRYDLGLQLDNTVRADGHHAITVTAYYQERLSAPPRVATMQAEVSFDRGSTWHKAHTVPTTANTFVANIKHPRKDQVSGAVSLRISATDTGGNTVKQTIPAAYRLS
ncbi:hypothetical protein [Allorhizocola rhizosphaerae]|uniref:hypothetical protein n=1 Tax=Allorhizocola rhizosphaerae TaxID=1872709 RepID=UPI0013C36092|nr:hypothetical protein [Allorhizocola rhizosphaerae]